MVVRALNEIGKWMVLSDEELIERYQSAPETAETRAFADELLRRYSARVFSWCWRFADDQDAAADLAQDVLLKAYRSLPAFRAESKFSTWLYLVVRNHCLNYVRNRKTEPVYGADLLEVEPADGREWDTLAVLLRESDLREVKKLVTEVLDETEAKVMMLHYGDEVPLGTVTRMLSLANASGAKAYIVSAKRKLSTALEKIRARDVSRRNGRLKGLQELK